MAAPEQGGGGGLLTRKLGPLPTWGWLGVITGAGVLYYIISKKKAATTAAAATTATTSTAAANVPDYVFQNYNQIPPITPAPKPTPGVRPLPAQPAPPKANPYGGVSDSAGNVYTYITSPAESQLLQSQGVQVYAETSPGVFIPFQQDTGTGHPLFQKIS